LETLLKDLQQAIASTSGNEEPIIDRRFHKHSQYRYYGLKTAQFRKVLKEFRPKFLALSLQDRLKLSEKLLRVHIGELGHAGIHIISLSTEQLEPLHLSLIDNMVDDFQSWSQVDHLCIDVLKPLLYKYKKETLSLLQKWNHSKNRFKRRASVVAFTRKVGASGGFIEEVLHLCENLVWDSEDIVQKGVGWALKDNLPPAPDKILPYIKDLRRRGVSSTIVLYAIRDLKKEERECILAIKIGSKGH